MQRADHSLLSPSLGSHKSLTSFHFGTNGRGPKVYIQASLHADELPGMLVAHHLRALLEAADATGQLLGEVVLVPVANPLGLAQRVDHKPMGRFDLDTSENFNRQYPDLAKAVWPAVQDAMGPDPLKNIATVRHAIGQYLQNWKPDTELQSLRHRLLSLAYDADYVLDLHCDCEAVMHFYTEEACWPAFEALTRFLQCRAILLAKNSGGGPFDECLSGVWWQLSDALGAAGVTAPLPQACCSTTIELRGETDVTHAFAQTDANALLAYLQHIHVVACAQPLVVPAALCQATPLAGSETLYAPCAGVVVFAAEVGQSLQVGDLVAEIIDPIANHSQRIFAGVAGTMYARIRDRYVTAGGELCKVAGTTPFRTGDLLGA
ncbi:MAG: succinylglutamate desuccinylase/aspartoacylase family protein [Rhodoferax sp.]